MKLKLRTARWKTYIDPTAIAEVAVFDTNGKELERITVKGGPIEILPGVTTIELKLDWDVCQP